MPLASVLQNHFLAAEAKGRGNLDWTGLAAKCLKRPGCGPVLNRRSKALSFKANPRDAEINGVVKDEGERHIHSGVPPDPAVDIPILTFLPRRESAMLRCWHICLLCRVRARVDWRLC